MYADDTQLYSMNHNTNFESKLQQFEECIEDIKKWMDLNKLKLNSEKTESMIVGSRRLMYKIYQTGLIRQICQIGQIDPIDLIC